MELKGVINNIGDLVTNHISAMLAYWDKDLICRFANASYLDWFGVRREDMIDKMTIKELLGPIYEKNEPYILGALAGNIQTFEREIPVPIGGGVVRHSLANYYPDIVNGQVRGFFVHVADITPVKVMEKELVQSNKIIREQNVRLLNFTNVVSHDLKTYASNLTSIIELLETANAEDQRSKMLDYLKAISKGFSATVSNLNKIITTQNQNRLDIQRVNLRQNVEKVLANLQVQILASHACVNNDINSSATIKANPAYIESVLQNLMTNTIKYKSPDRTPNISLNSYEEAERTVLIIQDNGKGINLEKHGKDLFGMYKTFHGNSDAQGMGLFITRYQIESMGGEIKVESQENVGTTFTIYFNS